MSAVIKPGAYLRRGRAVVSAEVAMFLIEHKDELEAVYDGLDARRDAALEAIAAAAAKLAAVDAREGELAADREKREGELAAVLSELVPREAAVSRGKKALTDLLAWMEANPLSEIEEH